MEAHERDVIQRLSEQNSKLRRLYQRHRDLEGKLEALERRRFRTTAEEVLLMKIKKQKLSGKDEMMRILASEGAVLHVS